MEKQQSHVHLAVQLSKQAPSRATSRLILAATAIRSTLESRDLHRLPAVLKSSTRNTVSTKRTNYRLWKKKKDCIPMGTVLFLCYKSSDYTRIHVLYYQNSLSSSSQLSSDSTNLFVSFKD